MVVQRLGKFIVRTGVVGRGGGIFAPSGRQLLGREGAEPQLKYKVTPIPAPTTAVRVVDVKGGAVVYKGAGAWGGEGEVTYTIEGEVTPEQAEQISKQIGLPKAKPEVAPTPIVAKVPSLPPTVPTITERSKQLLVLGRGAPIGVAPEVKTFIGGTYQTLYEFEKKKAEEGRGVYAIKKAREEREAQERLRLEQEYQENKLEGETKLEYIRRTQRGRGITQRYYELFGVQFYARSEREELVAEGLKNFTQAQTYEEQQEALQQLKAQGIEVKQVGDEYVIDREKTIKTLAPTSTLGNILVGVSDIMLKAKVFSPYLKTGAAKRQEQQIVYRRRFEPPEEVKKAQARELLRKYEKVYVKKGRKGLEKELVKTWKELKTPESKEGFRILIEELVRKDMIRVPVYQAPVVRTMFPEIELTFDITKFPAPEMQKVGEIITGAGLIKPPTTKPPITIPKQKQPIKAEDLIKESEEQLIKQQQKQKVRTLQQLKQRQKQVISTAVLQKVIQQTAQQQQLRLKQLQKQVFKQPPTYRIPQQLITPKLFFPKISFWRLEKRRKDYLKNLRKVHKKAAKQTEAYTASLAAAAFQAKPIKVTRKEFERLSKVEYYGWETRPVLEIKFDEDERKIKKELKSVNF